MQAAKRRRDLVIAHSPLARGLLSARYDATHRPRNLVRRRNPLFSVERLDRASGLFTALKEVAAGSENLRNQQGGAEK